MKRWEQFQNLSTHTSITGAIEKLTMSFPEKSKKTVFEVNLVTIIRETGLPEIWENPAKTFEGRTLETPWQDVHIAYFSGEATWNYLNSPFHYAFPNVVTEEMTPCEENGEVWRRLKITFPDNIVTHSFWPESFAGYRSFMSVLTK